MRHALHSFRTGRSAWNSGRANAVQTAPRGRKGGRRKQVAQEGLRPIAQAAGPSRQASGELPVRNGR